MIKIKEILTKKEKQLLLQVEEPLLKEKRGRNQK